MVGRQGGRSGLKQAYTAILKHVGAVVLAPAFATVALRLYELWENGELEQLLHRALSSEMSVSTAAVVVVAALLLYAVYKALFPSGRPTYLIDFSVHKGLDEWKFPKEWFLPQSALVGKGRFTQDDLDFQEKILMRSGLGDETYVPPWLYSKPPHYDMVHARKEF